MKSTLMRKMSMLGRILENHSNLVNTHLVKGKGNELSLF